MPGVTLTDLAKKKAEGKKITMLTAYDFPFAALVDQAEIDMILVGDSLGVVVQGKENTLPVTMDEMIYHTEMVARATSHSLVVGDMPFLSYQASREEAVFNAGRFLKEAGAQAVKLEGGAAVEKTIEAIAAAEIPVMAHIGLTPQSVHKMGGFKVQKEMDRLVKDAKVVEKAGAFAVVLECVPGGIAKQITREISIPTIGIGAGVDCDGQVLVLHDLLGLFDRFVPKFIKRYAVLGEEALKALRQYKEEVEQGVFPGEEHTFK
ncbi:MAG: 3-methyl-2-oxobutanoate hydroxymethyltransferase [Deltaproteobacteria bacterium]|nr:3-methyl-2-oxobutanoate hydroxymethyltransferase [Deltaproteobacteria bacterium]